MMMEWRSACLLCAVGVAWTLLAGCSSGPELGEAETALEQGDYARALARANEAIAQDTANAFPDPYLFKASVLRRRADSTMEAEQYIDLYRQAAAAEDSALAIDEDVDDEVAEARGQAYQREVRRGESAYNRANKYERPEVYRRAIGFFGAARVTQPDSARAALNEGFARLRVDQRAEAIPVLEHYVDRADTVALDAYKILGELYTANGRYEAATDLLDEATRTYPTDRALQALRLSVYNRSGDVDEALAAYREQIERTPEQPTYRYNYGALLLKAGRYAEAIEQLERAVEIRPDNAEGQYNLGAAYLNAALADEDTLGTIQAAAVALRDSAAAGLGDGNAPGQPTRPLSERRRALFENAIPPLERARTLTNQRLVDIPEKEALRQSACRALLVAYVRTQRPGRAAEVEDCTGFAQARR
jgi:tetratricopeptide (TPR) repeat protein